VSGRGQLTDCISPPGHQSTTSNSVDRSRSFRSRTRNSRSVALAFRQLHERHAGRMFQMKFVPPRDSGVRCSACSGPSLPQ